MSAKTEFFAPDYLPRFRCKMGACRSACCVGWPVSVSMKNYFTLLGLPCRKELRDRLDVALRLADHPTEEEYARFTPNWLGDCPMRMEDGRCSIQAELGEDALSDVCRLYPRGVRIWEGRYECSASNSCERTLELLWDEKEPMRIRSGMLRGTKETLLAFADLLHRFNEQACECTAGPEAVVRSIPDAAELALS